MSAGCSANDLLERAVGQSFFRKIVTAAATIYVLARLRRAMISTIRRT